MAQINVNVGSIGSANLLDYSGSIASATNGWSGAGPYSKTNSIGYSVNESGLYGSNFTQNPRNRKGDYGRSYIDQRFRFVMSHVWEIPWLRHARGPKNLILGGWAINGIVQLQSLAP